MATKGDDTMTAVFLTGFMGTGKTTVGRALAERLDTSFFDSDAEVECRAGKAVAAIFAEDGEPAFRALESSVLAELAKRDAVVALGGGALVADANYECVRRAGPVVCLKASVEEILARTAGDDRRPLLSGSDRQARVRALLEQRREAYARADIEIDTTGLGIAEVVDEIMEFLAKSGRGEVQRGA